MSEKDKCIIDLLELLSNIDKNAKNNDFSIFKASATGGCDQYQGMTSFQKSFCMLETKHSKIINEVVKNATQK